MKCPTCGKDWPDGAKFCGVCGTPLAGAASPATEKKDPEMTVPTVRRPPVRARREVKRKPPTPVPEPARIRPRIKPATPADQHVRATPPGFLTQMKILAERAGLKVEPVQGNVLRARLSVKDGRSQLIIFKHAGDLSGKPVVRINSPVANLKTHPVSGDAAIRLLKLAGTVKLGGFSIDENHLVVHQGMLLPDLTPNELRDMVTTIAFFADEVEKVLTGKDVY